MSDPALRAALFRFVDVRPACATPQDVTRHLHELLAEAEDSRLAGRATGITSRKLATRPVAAIAATGVKQMAQRFIVGADAKDSLPTITGLWKNGVDATVDLLGEATVTEAEADRYMRRCEDDAARARRRGQEVPEPRREPLRQGLRAHPAAAQPDGARARHRGRPAAPAPPAHRRPRRRRAPARRHGVLRHARGDHPADARSAQPSPSSPTARPPASCSRPTWSTRPSTSTS